MNLVKELSLLLPALIAGALVVISHVFLGREVVRRGIIFIDLAIAQIAAIGVIAAGLLGIHSVLGTQLFAACAALLGAGLLSWTETRLGRLQEPLIGVLFVLAATAGLLMLAHDAHGGEALKDMLAGQILWVTYSQILFSSVVLVPALVAWLLLPEKYRRSAFYPIFAIMITTSVQLVGVYLVFATLVIPALAVFYQRRGPLISAMAIGLIGYGCGLVLSLITDLPAAPLVVWVLAITGGVFVGFRGYKLKTIENID